jgi:hypothetical protein
MEPRSILVLRPIGSDTNPLLGLNGHELLDLLDQAWGRRSDDGAHTGIRHVRFTSFPAIFEGFALHPAMWLQGLTLQTSDRF